VATLLLSAGDASGDLHAADFALHFRQRHPGCRILGLGGDAMRKAGVELVADQADLAVGGLFELAGSLPRVARVWRRLGAALAAARPDLVVLIDSSGFNLPFARRARRLGAPILYYVAPQVWAWRAGRLRKLARRVDRLAVIFPFEPAVYRGTGLPVDFVGNPLVDSLARFAACTDRASARERCGVPHAGAVVALLPGSRRNEIAAHLGVQLETAALLRARHPDMHFVLAVPPSLEGAVAEGVRDRCEAARAEGLPVHFGDRGAREAILASEVVLAKPGTVTMECALLGRPLVVMGRANPLTAWIVRRAIRVPSLAMPNLIAGEPIVPEFLQNEAVPSRLAAALESLLAGPAREAQLAGLARVREALGPGGAAERACEIAEEMIASARA
jgi:lipid-A-disaccharide synthase